MSDTEEDRDDAQREPEEMELEELREEYSDLAGLGPSEPWEQDRKMNIWYELCDRVDVDQPECPHCGERNWGQAPGEPVRCNACDHPLGRDPELRQEIQNAWNEIMYGDDEKQLVTDGGVPTDDTDDEPHYRHVTAVRLLEDDPVNEKEEGEVWFVPGERYNGDDYRVMTERDSLAIATETVLVVQLEEALPREEATDVAAEKAKSLVASAPDDVEEGDEPKLLPDGGRAESATAVEQMDTDSQEYREMVRKQLLKEGHEDVADWVNGFTKLTEFEIEDFLELVNDSWVVQLVGSSSANQFTRATTGELIKCVDGDQDGDFGRAHEAYVGEFEDLLFSGQFRVELLFPEDSAFEVTSDA